MKSVIVVGGTGQFKIVKSILEQTGGSRIVALFDDKIEASPYESIPLFRISELQDWIAREENVQGAIMRKLHYTFIVAVGNPSAAFRCEMSRKLCELGLHPLDILHPSAIIEQDVEFGLGKQIGAGVVVDPGTKFGDYCIMNANSSVDHDCIIGHGVEIGPGATVCGAVDIGDYTWIGANATVKDHITIGKNVVVGCGANVVKDLEDNIVVVGNPAKVLRKNGTS